MNRFVRLAATMSLIAGLSACATDGGPNRTFAKDDVPAAREPPKQSIPAGTRLRINLIDALSTATNVPGDVFLASIAEPIVVNGQTVVAKGTKVRGRVTDVNESGRVKGRASIRLVLTHILTEHKEVVIKTKPFIAVAEGTKKRDAGVIAGGTGLGTVVGAVAGGKKGAVIGAAVGAGAGTGTVLATKGKDLHYGPETRLSFTLVNVVEM